MTVFRINITEKSTVNPFTFISLNKRKEKYAFFQPADKAVSVTIEIENIAGNASKNHHQKVKQTYSSHISSDIFLNLKVCHFKTVRSLGMEQH